MFGEETLFFNSPNTYTIRANTPVTCLVIKYDDLKRDFKKLLKPLGDFFIERHQIIQDRED